MAETFKLPCSSYEELIKLFQAYANTKEGTALSLDEITQATGVPRTIVSKNNGFMVQVGLITEGNKKAATETGRALGRAYAPAPSTAPDAPSPIGLQRRQLPGPFRVSSASQTEVLCATEYP